MAREHARFDPYSILQALDRHRVSYVVIGGFARVIHGTEEITRGIDIVPSTRPENLPRLDAALREIGAQRIDGHDLPLDDATLTNNPFVELATNHGEMKIVPTRAGTRGFDDLRRRGNREPVDRGVRPCVASIDDLARTLSALESEQNLGELRQLRRLDQLERGRTRAIER